jgi:hypothetical protein
MNRISMRLKSGEEDRAGFVDPHMMLLVNAHPQIKIAGDTEVEHEETIDGNNTVNKYLKLAPELIEANINLVNFGNSYVEDVMHLMC